MRKDRKKQLIVKVRNRHADLLEFWTSRMKRTPLRDIKDKQVFVGLKARKYYHPELLRKLEIVLVRIGTKLCMYFRSDLKYGTVGDYLFFPIELNEYECMAAVEVDGPILPTTHRLFYEHDLVLRDEDTGTVHCFTHKSRRPWLKRRGIL